MKSRTLEIRGEKSLETSKHLTIAGVDHEDKNRLEMCTQLTIAGVK
jgi:hypothetical protein